MISIALHIAIRIDVIFSKIIIFLLLFTASAIAQSPAPPVAQKYGFITKTFDTKFDDENLDRGDRRDRFFHWYIYRMFGYTADTSNISAKDDGSITLSGQYPTLNAQIATITPLEETPHFRGTAFGGGGYFSASLKFNPRDVSPGHLNGWPSFWALPVESAFGKGGRSRSQWPGQAPGFQHNIEIDILEYIHSDIDMAAGKFRYGAAIHDWYGVYGVDCQKLCGVQNPIKLEYLPPDTNWNQFHDYGLLWVPATEMSNGFAEFYFDGKLMGRSTSWSLWDTNLRLPPPKGDWIYSWIDKQHFFLIIGTGVSQPLTVRRVEVWQTDQSKNIINN